MFAILSLEFFLNQQSLFLIRYIYVYLKIRGLNFRSLGNRIGTWDRKGSVMINKQMINDSVLGCYIEVNHECLSPNTENGVMDGE